MIAQVCDMHGLGVSVPFSILSLSYCADVLTQA